MANFEPIPIPEAETEVPPVVDSEVLSAFGSVLNAEPGATPTLVGANGERAALPPVLLEILRDSVELLKAGHGVRLIATTKNLTTQEAADLIGVSRLTLVGLLESGELPFERIGNRRRIRLEDVQAYQERRAAEQRAAMDRLAAIGNRDGMYEEDFTSEGVV